LDERVTRCNQRVCRSFQMHLRNIHEHFKPKMAQNPHGYCAMPIQTACEMLQTPL
jgi:hypothetical protein